MERKQVDELPTPFSGLLTTSQAATFLGVSPRTLEDWRLRGGGPQFRKLRRLVRYHPADLMRFAERDIRDNTGQRDLVA